MNKNLHKNKFKPFTNNNGFSIFAYVKQLTKR